MKVTSKNKLKVKTKTMKKIIYIFTIITAIQVSTYAQADLEVESNGILEKTLVVGENAISSNEEIIIHDYDSDGAALLRIKNNVVGILGIDNDFGGVIGAESFHNIEFWSGGAQRMIIDNVGEVGLGTTNPGATLHVSDPGVSGQQNIITVLESAASNRPALLFSENGLEPGSTMGILYNGASSGDNEKLQIINDTEQAIVTWTNDQKMGIGTTAPREALDVDGNIGISAIPGSLIIDNATDESELTYDGTNLKLITNGGNANILSDRRVILEATNETVTIDADNDIVFELNNTTAMNCKASGDWGLNQANPTARFHVKQNTTNLPAVMIENDQNTNDWDWEVDNAFLNLSFNNVLKGSYSSTGTYTSTSDVRLKEQITPLKDGALISVMKLEPSSYYFKSDIKSEHNTIGFIAQNVQEYFPTLVSEDDNADSDLLGVKYAMVGVVAVKAIQEQNSEVKKLMKEVAQDKVDVKEIDDVAQALVSLEQRIAKLK